MATWLGAYVAGMCASANRFSRCGRGVTEDLRLCLLCLLAVVPAVADFFEAVVKLRFNMGASGGCCCCCCCEIMLVESPVSLLLRDGRGIVGGVGDDCVVVIVAAVGC